ncbi:catalase [Dietzia psychralcaliphila]|uniref:Catalase n=1 Tax=Dietzia psychralcaliphila TaxID=139021 RepID=A0AAD0JN54_9ACTN|nr:catalase [Dietzia psychralcaliphila]AWH94220.1 catalase HPII [Dietzia psychralcaliphila]PTM87810.1 catalase [Dietzia psychralcaliphila]
MSDKKSAASKTAGAAAKKVADAAGKLADEVIGGGDVVPGVPAPTPPSLEEPTSPTGPLPPKPDQKGATPFSPTGAESADTEDAARQQGEFLTTAQGARLTDTDHSQKAGRRGPTLLQDHHLREKITHFDHERIPERVVHARGTGAHGVFTANGAAASVCRAGLFAEGKETEVFVRFSTVLGSRGSADTVRDTRGFATKFYSEEGTWDLVGNNIPVFFIQDAIKFPDVIHAGKPHPDREIPQAQSAHDTFWDFVSLHTEGQAHAMWNMSDRGIPRSYRMMEGFGVHTFRLINAAGETNLVKFHWKPHLGVHSLVWEEAQIAAGMDPDLHRRDLADAIEAGAFPSWDLGIQVFPDTVDENGVSEMFHGIDLLDPTKFVPEELAPVQIIGTMTLNANNKNFFAETEQVAFHPGHLVPGIDVTNDPLLQGRLFSYLDTQISRLGGPNFGQIPINRPHAPVNDMLRDGMHQTADHVGVAPYKPNSLDGGCPFLAGADDGALVEVAQHIADAQVVRDAPASFDDHYSQATLFYNSMTEVEKEHIAGAYTFELGKCYEENIKVRQVEQLAHIDHDLAVTVATGLGLPAPAKVPVAKVVTSPALSQIGREWPSDGRLIGILVTEASDVAAVKVLEQAVFDDDMVPLVIAPTGGKLGGGDPDDPATVTVSRTYRTQRSIEFDALVVVDLPADPNTDVLISEMFRHKKAIASLAPVDQFVDFGLTADTPGVVVVDEAAGVLPALKPLLATHRAWDRPDPARI